jgi:hypothetical protein
VHALPVEGKCPDHLTHLSELDFGLKITTTWALWEISKYSGPLPNPVVVGLEDNPRPWGAPFARSQDVSQLNCTVRRHAASAGGYELALSLGDAADGRI